MGVLPRTRHSSGCDPVGEVLSGSSPAQQAFFFPAFAQRASLPTFPGSWSRQDLPALCLCVRRILDDVLLKVGIGDTVSVGDSGSCGGRGVGILLAVTVHPLQLTHPSAQSLGPACAEGWQLGESRAVPRCG